MTVVKSRNFFILLLFCIVGVRSTDDDYQPEQVHIAFGEKTNDITIVWVTQAHTESIVEYGLKYADHKVTGKARKFKDKGEEGRRWWIHRAELKHLKHRSNYTYRVGSSRGWSEWLTFKTPPSGENFVVSAAIYGDMGAVNARSLPYLQADTESGAYHFVIHVGDFAYDLASDNSRVGDQFMRRIQPIASTVPYMTCVGNHEYHHNFKNYRKSFSMPRTKDNFYYSWNIGPVHFLAWSTEFYYNLKRPHAMKKIKKQYRWIKADLAEANKPKNRAKRPWLVMYAHRPMYCSSDADECQWSDVPQRGGVDLPEPGFGIEPLLKEFGVDLVIFGHEHAYERMWPVYNFTVYDNNGKDPYVNPRAPVHLITGSAGCREKTYPINKMKPYTAFACSDYGYSRFKAYNKTHISIEQVSVDQNGKSIDKFYIVKETHAPYDSL